MIITTSYFTWDLGFRVVLLDCNDDPVLVKLAPRRTPKLLASWLSIDWHLVTLTSLRGTESSTFPFLVSKGLKNPCCIMFVCISLGRDFQALHLVAIATRRINRDWTACWSLLTNSKNTESGWSSSLNLVRAVEKFSKKR